jgi:hypothetical protein
VPVLHAWSGSRPDGRASPPPLGQPSPSKQTAPRIRARRAERFRASDAGAPDCCVPDAAAVVSWLREPPRIVHPAPKGLSRFVVLWLSVSAQRKQIKRR